MAAHHSRSVCVFTVHSVDTYSSAELQRAVDVAYALNRGKFVLCIPPAAKA